MKLAKSLIALCTLGACMALAQPEVESLDKVRKIQSVHLLRRSTVFDGGSQLFEFRAENGARFVLVAKRRRTDGGGVHDGQEMLLFWGRERKLKNAVVMAPASALEHALVSLIKDATIEEKLILEDRTRRPNEAGSREWLLERLTDRQKKWE